MPSSPPPPGESVGQMLRANPVASVLVSYCIPVHFLAVLRIRIRVHRIHMFLGHPDPDTALDPDPDPSLTFFAFLQVPMVW